MVSITTPIMGSLPIFIARRPVLQILALVLLLAVLLVMKESRYPGGDNTEGIHITDVLQQESQIITNEQRENLDIISTKYMEVIENDNLPELSPTVESPLVVVLLASTPRSGSSMMGQLLNSMDENSVYFFEPLYPIKHTPCIENAECVGEHLAKRYMCNGTKIKECMSASTRVIKLVRGTLETVSSVLKDERYNVKLIHLTRDPRGALKSISVAGWDSDPTARCKEINEDMEEFEQLSNIYPGRVMKISYERFCVDFDTATRDIYKFLYGKNDLPKSVVQYLEDHMQENEKGYRNIHRNASSHYQEWRLEIKEAFLQKIEQEPYCQTILSNLRYALFGTKEKALNLSYPLFLD